MSTEFRNSGINVLGDIAWGTHFCHFYETTQDLLDTLVPYFKAGLENNEFCLWVVADSDVITVEEAKGALAKAVPDLDRHLSDENIEILTGRDWYLEKSVLNLESVKNGWEAKAKEALARGYDGLRVSADTFWLAEKDWKEFIAYEKQLNDWISDQYMTVICTYPLAKSGATEVLDVVQAHQFATARRQGKWEVIETPELIEAKAEIKRLNEELEQRVVERTGQLAKAIEELTDEISDRKQSEIELRLAHQRLSYHVENTPLAVIEWDKDLFIKRWSKRAEEVFGWTASEAHGINMYDRNFPVVHEEDAQAVAETSRQLINGTVDRNLGLNRNYTKDGNVIYCEWYNSVLRDEEGNVITILSLVHDVTERKHAEALLHAKEQEFRAIVENAPDQIIRYDREFRRTYVNPAVTSAYGLPAEALVGKHIGSVIQAAGLDVKERELEPILQRITDVFDTGESCEFEITWPTPAGRKYYSARLFPELDLNGSVINVLGIARDITERKQAEEKLKQSESQLAEAQRLANIGSWSLDLQSNAVTWSDELYRIFGVQPTEFDHSYEAVIGTIHPQDRDRLRRIIDKALETHESFNLYYRITQPTGEVRVIHARGAVVTDEHGNASRLHGAAQDVTERKQAEEALQTFSKRLLEAQEAERRRVARELHDEIGQALTAIKINLRALQYSAADAQLVSQLNESTGIVDQALDRVRDLALNLRPSLLDDLGLVAALRWYVDHEAQRSDLVSELVTDLAETPLPPELETACFRITQEALTNVVRHAHATRVRVELRQHGSELHIVIRDDGIGFEIDSIRGQRASEMNLGLQGMEERALILGGEIEITSAPSSGTEIHVRLPVPDTEPSPAS